MSNDKKYFPRGLYFNLPHENAPDFVKGQVSIKVEEFQRYLENVKGDRLNIDLKVSREGKAYAEVNTFKPERQNSDRANSAPAEKPAAVPDNFDDVDDDLPF